eukprot:CAMPEP_0173236748 /NCGR_PEP_ID=MMETSP1142-20121109/11633_1 /TAXON_ID=483371 /ORGANISM="non described non described, Strain CCMP2298" /LENGTH=81 /DNA_ID=CAMNT_0014167293 /DNA_START=248 /DNA_END=493 /DNA_ORIENTATION=+
MNRPAAPSDRTICADCLSAPARERVPLEVIMRVFMTSRGVVTAAANDPAMAPTSIFSRALSVLTLSPSVAKLCTYHALTAS